MSARAFALIGAVAVALGACGGKSATRAPRRPAGYHPEVFTDIRLPAGCVLVPDHDQLAVSYAGGSIRRYDVWIEPKPGEKSQPVAELLTYFKRTLPQGGWTAVADE